MASKPSKPVKQLKQLLQEQQEPFILEIYLVERGYPRKSLDSEGSFGCCYVNSGANLNKSAPKKSPKGIPQCSKIFRSVHNQVISINERLRTKSCSNFCVTKVGRNDSDEQVSELDRFSSASSTTVFHSCSEDDAEEVPNPFRKDHIDMSSGIEKEQLTDRRNLQWQYIEGSGQLSFVSALDPKHELFLGSSPLHYDGKDEITSKRANFAKKVSEDSILSASLWKILFQSAPEKPRLHSKPLSQDLRSRQLLFDCVREVVETQRRKEKQQQKHGKECFKMRKPSMGEKQTLNGKQESNLVVELLECDYLETAQEWSSYKQQRKGLVKEIGDDILEKIKDEIVTDMMHLNK